MGHISKVDGWDAFLRWGGMQAQKDKRIIVPSAESVFADVGLVDFLLLVGASALAE